MRILFICLHTILFGDELLDNLIALIRKKNPNATLRLVPFATGKTTEGIAFQSKGGPILHPLCGLGAPAVGTPKKVHELRGGINMSTFLASLMQPLQASTKEASGYSLASNGIRQHDAPFRFHPTTPIGFSDISQKPKISEDPLQTAEIFLPPCAEEVEAQETLYRLLIEIEIPSWREHSIDLFQDRSWVGEMVKGLEAEKEGEGVIAKWELIGIATN